MNRGVLRSDVDLRTQSDRGQLWTGTDSGVQITPIGSGPVVGASVSWPATANTLTSWVEITPSSPFDCCAIDVYFSGHREAAQATALLFDIGIGPPTETVFIDGIPLFGHSRFLCVRFPVRVAAGTRFSFRVQAETAAGSLTSPDNPTVALGFIRDIPEFPAGSSISTVGTVDRSHSTYSYLSSLAKGQARRVWAAVGDLPAGKTIYLIPCPGMGFGSNGVQGSSSFVDFGWSPDTGNAPNTLVAAPAEVFCADQFTYTDTSETCNPVIPTVWVPDGYSSGSIVAAVDGACAGAIGSLALACFAVVE